MGTASIATPLGSDPWERGSRPPLGTDDDSQKNFPDPNVGRKGSPLPSPGVTSRVVSPTEKRPNHVWFSLTADAALPGTVLYVQDFPCIITLCPHSKLMTGSNYFPQFTEEPSEAQTGEIIVLVLLASSRQPRALTQE